MTDEEDEFCERCKERPCSCQSKEDKMDQRRIDRMES